MRKVLMVTVVEAVAGYRVSPEVVVWSNVTAEVVARAGVAPVNRKES